MVVIPRRKIELGSKAGQSCGIDGGPHVWKCANYARYILRETCDCGAVQFEPSQLYPDAEIIRRIQILNEKHSRPGKEFNGVMPAKTLAKLTENLPKQVQNKEETMAAQVNIKDLTPETRQKLIESLPPIPPKPDISGLKNFDARKAIGKYYREHDAEMLADYNLLGDSGARQRWGCSGCFWVKFRRAHGLLIPVRHYKKRQAAIPDKNNLKILTPEEHEKTLKPPPAPAGTEKKPEPEKYRCLSGLPERCKFIDDCRAAAHGYIIVENKDAPACLWYERETPPAHPEPVEGERKEHKTFMEECIESLQKYKTAESPSCVITYTLRLDTEQLEKDIAAAREKLLNLNALQLSVLPRFRWWWLPSVQKKYLEILQEIICK